MSQSNQSQNPVEKTWALSRRSFLKGAGITSIGLAIAGQNVLEEVKAKESQAKVFGPGAISIELKVNGKMHSVKIEPRHTLAEVLRDQLHLTGTKIGCDRGACGACTVIVDNHTVPSCMTLAIDAHGKDIQTIEGLGEKGLDPLQKSFIEHDALQCGFCTPGMVMSCKNLLNHNPNPHLSEVKEAVRGNLCRCGTYPKVFAAVLALKKQHGKGDKE